MIPLNINKFLKTMIVVILAPLFFVFIFFIYKINSTYRLKPGEENKKAISRSETGKEVPGGLRNITSAQSALEELAQHPLLGSFLKELNQTNVNNDNNKLEFDRKQGMIYGYIEEFIKAGHQEFKEVILKNAKTGNVYIRIPSEATGENRPGVRIIITVPVSDSKDNPSQALLLGFIEVAPLVAFRKASEEKASTISTNSSTSTSSSARGLAWFFALFFLFLTIFIPISMFLFYRRVKKVASQHKLGSLSYPQNLRHLRDYPRRDVNE